MTKFVYRNGQVIEKTDEYEVLPSVTAVISDTMEPLKHHGSGRTLDSKSKYRADTKACGMIETGNETIKPRQPIRLDRGQRREAIKRTIYELRNGRI